MLPFLDKKKVAATIMDNRKSDGERSSMGEKKEESDSPAAKLIKAVHDKDATAVMRAFEELFNSMEAKEDEAE